MKNKTRLSAILLLVTTFPPGVGCIPETSRNPSARRIGISYITSENPFFPAIAKEAGKTLKEKGYVVVSGDARNDHDLQAKQIAGFLESKVDAILLIPCNSKAIGPSVRAANQAGVPVFTADVAVLDPGADVVCHVATDNYGGGKLAAHQILDSIDRKGKIAVIDYPGIESVEMRIKGFTRIIDYANNEGAQIEIVAVEPAFGDRATAKNIALKLLDEHPDIAAFFAVNDPIAFGVLDALRERNLVGKVKIVGFDGTEESKELVREGAFHADIIQLPEEIAVRVAGGIEMYFEGKPVPTLVLIPTSAYKQ